ncbi:MAG: polysaccharide deacetylase family protein [Tannerellaceae bacterium]|jgi:peptidoglycan/xylan/chitin deacetylase (PgdA/CDA1 family)|nr:polysaccharide deacetylase family protein [Tannerellaceae bacterium]
MIVIVIISVLVVIGIYLVYASYRIDSGIYVKALCRKKTDDKIVALTFDDGPDPTNTPPVLDVLRRYSVQATFFCIGKRAEEQPDIIRRIQQEGHLAGNHSYVHTPSFPLFSTARMTADLQQSQQVLERITGTKIILFRPPYGVTNPMVRKVVCKLGYTVIGWSIRSFDTRKEEENRIFNRIVKQIKPGAVILLHDRLPGSAALVMRLLDYLKRQGYKVVRIDKLFEL